MVSGILGGGWLVTALAAYFLYRKSDKRGKEIQRLKQRIETLERTSDIVQGSLEDSATADVDSVRDKYTA